MDAGGVVACGCRGRMQQFDIVQATRCLPYPVTHICRCRRRRRRARDRDELGRLLRPEDAGRQAGHIAPGWPGVRPGPQGTRRLSPGITGIRDCLQGVGDETGVPGRCSVLNPDFRPACADKPVRHRRVPGRHLESRRFQLLRSAHTGKRRQYSVTASGVQGASLASSRVRRCLPTAGGRRLWPEIRAGWAALFYLSSDSANKGR